MGKKVKKNILSKSDVGNRFRQFREAIRKTQYDLADELKIYQSAITNIERGKTFPKISYLLHMHRQYDLNINWLLAKEGDMLGPKDVETSDSSSIMDLPPHYGDQTHGKYTELINLMQIPVIEQVILAKLIELKALLKDEIKEFHLESEKKTG